MSSAIELFREGKTRELWQRCCGFIDLSVEGFLAIQRQLLLEQLALLQACELGRRVMRGARPRTVEEFREQVPFTTYHDYASDLLCKREDSLPGPPLLWQRTSGRSGQYPVKWVPVAKRMAEEMAPTFLAILIFATCKERGDFALEENENSLYLLAPPPYASGSWARWGASEFPMAYLPSLEESEAMPFEERVEKGFDLAVREGVSVIFGISSILVAVGRMLGQRNGREFRSLVGLLSRPGAFLRLSKALLRSKLARRPILPKDLWTLKGLIAGGTDTAVYKEKIKGMWGRYPLNIYGCTESLIIAMQTWGYRGMTFVPYFSFLEFIPEDEHQKSKADPYYQPRTVLLNEVEAGRHYELVITNFHGGVFVRYRIGDLITIVSMADQELHIALPQMEFYGRADDVIDFAAFTHASLTEKMIWQALEDSGIDYVDWTAHKEARGEPQLHLHIEVNGVGHGNEQELAQAVHRQLKRQSQDYADMETLLGIKPVRVTLLPQGAFKRYVSTQRAAGADLAHLKPPHMNPIQAVIDSLMNGARQRAGDPLQPTQAIRATPD